MRYILSHPGYLHGALQMFGPEKGECNYLALENIYGLILWIHAFSPPKLNIMFVCWLLENSSRLEGVTGTPGPPVPSYAPVQHITSQINKAKTRIKSNK